MLLQTKNLSTEQQNEKTFKDREMLSKYTSHKQKRLITETDKTDEQTRNRDPST